MKKLYLLLTLLFAVSLSNAQFWTFDFETPGGFTVNDTLANDHADDYFAVVSNDSITPDFSNYHGNLYFAAQDVDAEGLPADDTIWFDPIDISSAGDTIYLNFLAGSYYAASAKWDVGDFVHFDYSFDGVNYQPFIWFENDGSTYNSIPYLDTDFDGTGDVDAGLSASMKTFGGFIVRNGNNTLYLRVDLHLDSGSEDFAFDYLTLSDQPPVVIPKIISAVYYPGDSIVVTYDNSLSSVNVSDYILKTGSDITFGSATLSPDNTSVILKGFSGSVPNDGLIDTLIDQANGDTVTLYTGIVPINYLNAANSVVVENGVTMTITGVVTGDDNYKNVFIADQSGAYHGILIYDNAGNLPDQVNVGDSIVVMGTRTEYGSMTEFIPTNLIFVGTPSSLSIDPVVVPPSMIDTTLGANDANAEPYEGVLIKVEEMTVISDMDNYYVYRLANADNTAGIFVDDLLDYHYGDGLSLTVGRQYNITGIVNYSYGVYRLNPRGISDVEALIPEMVTAVYYPGDSIVITYNRQLTSISDTNYVLKTGSDITFATAALSSDGLKVTLKDFSDNVPNDGMLDTLIDIANSDTINLYTGIVPINYLNSANDIVVENNMPMTVTGIVTGNNNYRHVFIADQSGAYHGIMIYDNTGTFPGLVDVGDSIVVMGKRTEYNGMTEFLPLQLISANTPTSLTIEPVVIPASAIDTNLAENDPNAEPYEGVLVKVEQVTVTQDADNYYVYRLSNADNTAGIFVDDFMDYQYQDGLTMTVGNTYNISGLVGYAYGAYRLYPRSASDVEEYVPAGILNAENIAVYPNPVENTLYLNGIRSVRIYDNTGRLIIKSNVTNNSTLNVSDMAPGIYTLRYIDNNGNVGSMKIIKK